MLLTVACVASALLVAVTGGRDQFSPATEISEGLQRSVDDSTDSATLPKPNSSRYLVIVSTLDGHVTALNAVTGVEQWSVSTGTSPLLSSSISKLEVMHGDKLVHLVPSLDGDLYQFDGDGIEPVPLGADLLLSSTFRFMDDTTIVGGKEVQTYGIDLNTGKVRYACSAAGCKYFGRQAESIDSRLFSDDVLVVKRSTKTVRAVELQTGNEKWNFSVGQNDLSYVTREMSKAQDMVHEDGFARDTQDMNKRDTKLLTEATFPETNYNVFNKRDESGGCRRDRDVLEEANDQCDIQTEDAEDYEEMFDSSTSQAEMLTAEPDDVDLRVIVPNGHVVAVNRKNRGNIYWQHKFASGIAAAWTLHSHKLSELSLFNTHDFPGLEDLSFGSTCSNNGEHSDPDDTDTDVIGPLLYIGAFNGQIYVQPLTSGIREVNLPSTTTAISRGLLNIPHIRWRPYIATAPSRTPSASMPRNRLLLGSDADSLTTAVIQWHEQYPFDEGFFLFPDYTPVQRIELPGNETTLVRDSDRTRSLLNWW